MTRVLVVDSSGADARQLRQLLEQAELEVRVATTSAEARVLVERWAVDLVLADANCGDEQGISLVEELHRSHPRLPIVVLTSEVLTDSTGRALQAGAVSFVRKSRLNRDVPQTLQHVLNTFRQLQDTQKLRTCFIRLEAEYYLNNDPSLVTALVAECEHELQYRQLFEESVQRRLLICLQEAVDNAIFHGNLEVSSHLRDSGEIGAYHRLAEQRRKELPYCDRRVTVRLRLQSDLAEFIVKDEGPGFDPTRIADPTRGENIAKVSGRGLFLMRTFMDEVEYNGAGNQLRMCKRVVPLS